MFIYSIIKKSILNFLRKYYLTYKVDLIIGGVSLFCLSLLILPTPLITRRIIDYSLPNKNLKELLFLIIVVFFLLLITKAITYFQGILFYKINTKIVLDIKMNLLKKINRLSLRTSKQFSTGYLISRINDDTGRLQSLFADTLVSMIKDIFTFLVGITVIFFIHWKLAIISIIILPFFAWSAIYFSRRVRVLSQIYYENNAQTTSQLEEALNSTEISKLFLRFKYSLLRYYIIAKRTFRSNITLGSVSILNSIVIGFISGLCPIIVIGYGGYEIIQGKLTIGSLVAFNSFAGYLFGPTNRLVNFHVRIQKALTALKRIIEIIELPEEEIDEFFQIPEVINKIELNNINFSYREDMQIIKDFNLTLNKGDRIGIVGSSGSGKTTIIRLLTGLYLPNSGTFSLNGMYLTPAQIVSLRKYIAVVEQEPFLFNDTIYNNIRFSNPKATNDQIIEAAKNAHADEFIKDMKNGYLSNVSNKTLSTGQKQRIMIARALVRNPKILILDEATSNIDAISENYINKTINGLSDNIIVFIVAHRLNTIRKCNKIIVLEEGKIIQTGNHDELSKINGSYRNLINTNNS